MNATICTGDENYGRSYMHHVRRQCSCSCCPVNRQRDAIREALTLPPNICMIPMMLLKLTM